MSKKFSCPCDDHECKYNPANHDKGCDLCVEISIEDKELPKCFFQKAGGDIGKITDWSFESFARIVTGQ